MPQYMVDIIRDSVPKRHLTVFGMWQLVCEHVGGVIAYGFEENVLDTILTVLNHVDRNEDETDPYWFSDQTGNFGEQSFDASLEQNDLDMLSKDGKVIGFLMRDNPASIYLLTLLNGNHMMPYPKWHAKFKKLRQNSADVCPRQGAERMSSESVRILWEFKKLAEAMRTKSNEDGIKDTELELVYEACAGSVERTISVANEMFGRAFPQPVTYVGIWDELKD